MGKRFSIITDDLTKCILCDSPNVEIHHVFGGACRTLSEQCHLIVPLCKRHHTGNEGVHFNPMLMDALHELGQKKFEEHYPEQDFKTIFGRNYRRDK